MFTDLVKAVTFTCPSCNTSIKFDVLPGDDEIQELYKTVSRLECPKCKTSLSGTGTETIRAVLEYNNSVSKLSALKKCMDIELN